MTASHRQACFENEKLYICSTTTIRSQFFVFVFFAENVSDDCARIRASTDGLYKILLLRTTMTTTTMRLFFFLVMVPCSVHGRIFLADLFIGTKKTKVHAPRVSPITKKELNKNIICWLPTYPISSSSSLWNIAFCSSPNISTRIHYHPTNINTLFL